MFNKKSEEVVKDYKLSEKFYKPHTDYNLKYLLNSILDNYDIPVDKYLPKDCFEKDKKYKHIILIVLDGFSVNLFKETIKLLPEEIRQYLEKKLLISEITSFFLPTTTSVIPFLMTGLLPEESGLYEWWQYEHHVDEVIVPFKTIYKEEDTGERFPIDGNVDFGEIFSKSKFHKLLKNNGVDTFVYLDPSYTSPFNTISSTYANIVETRRFTEQRVKTVENIKDNYKGETFHYLYDPNIDAVQHYNGVYCKNSFAIAQNLLFEIYQLINDIEQEGLKEVQVLITADHGLISTDYKNILHLEKKIELEKYLKRNSKGRVIGIGGGIRTCILHVKEEFLDEFVKKASKACEGYGKVFTLDDIYREGLFNKEIVCENFKKNMGNVLIAAYDNMGIWYDEELSRKFKASHGGLSYDELHVPLMSYGR